MFFDSLYYASFDILLSLLPNRNQQIARRLDFHNLILSDPQCDRVLGQIKDDDQRKTTHEQLTCLIHVMDVSGDVDVTLLQVGYVWILSIGKHYLTVGYLHNDFEIRMILAENDLMMVGRDLH